MNIEEINPSDIEIPVSKFRKELNPNIWTSDNKLKPEVKDRLLKVGASFYKSLELSLKIKDIYFTGSLANYSWTEKSDIDLHLMIDYADTTDIPFLEEYLYLKKENWINNHDVKIFGFEVEPFAKDVESLFEYKAVYSLCNDEWVRPPIKEQPEIDTSTIKDKSSRLMNQIEDAVSDSNAKRKIKNLDKIKEKVSGLRNIGLNKDGEFSVENIVYKTLRRSGHLDMMYDEKNKAVDSLMSLSESVNRDEPVIHKLSVQKGIEGMDHDKVDVIKKFIAFVCGKLKMEEPVSVFLRNGRDKYISTTASYVPSENTNHVRCGGRALVDILRSIAHELVHNRQRELGIFNSGDAVQNIGGSIEDQANSVAGVFIKDFTHNYGFDDIYDF